jgi:XTP/dITP diphosphohydrolase
VSAGHLRLVLASANPDKVAEIAAILGPVVELLPRPAGVPDVEETGTTLEENARLKAVALVEATGEAAVADDTGLEVDALDGAPGVRSGRFAGEGATYADNVDKMLTALAGVAPPQRTARFRTVAMVRFPDGRELITEGVVEGAIAAAPAGAGGFGYDPVFVPADADGRTFAQLTPTEKNQSSHRAQAFQSLLQSLVSSEF